MTTRNYSANVLSALARIEKKTGRKPTDFQADIYAWLIDGSGHAIVNAVAGSGKTTTLIDGITAITYGTKRPSILMLAFNKSIAEELTAKIPQNATAKTLNSLGAGILFKNLRSKPALRTDKTELIAKGVAGFDQLIEEKRVEFLLMLPALKRLVSLFKGFGFGAIRAMPTFEDMTELCDRYDIEISDEVNISEFFDTLIKTFNEGIKNTRIIDFDDQLFLPIYHDMPFPSYFNFVFVDESQDLNPIQNEMVKRTIRNAGRAVFVGDRHQAIYGFRGADPEAMDTVSREFNATELPLSTCWRCPVSVIREAQKIVPHIEAAPNAAKGRVYKINEEKMMDTITDGDYVVGRTCAPLVELCMDMIRLGKKATVKGSDIGEGLVNLAGKIARKKLPGGIWDQIKTWGDMEVGKLNKPGQETKAQRLQDRVDTLLVLAEDCETVADIRSKIKGIFSDKSTGIVLSTIHKVKGLESKKVFIVHPELLPHPMAKKAWAVKQESNLKYVAITRATEEMVWVTPKKPIRFRKG